MKTWAYWNKIIRAEFKHAPFCNVADAPWYQDRTTRCSITILNEEHTSDICRQFIHTGKWPFLTMEESFCIRQRLDNALDLVESLLISQGAKCDVVVRPPDLKITPEHKVWEFLLFDWWKVTKHKYTVANN